MRSLARANRIVIIRGFVATRIGKNAGPNCEAQQRRAAAKVNVPETVEFGRGRRRSVHQPGQISTTVLAVQARPKAGIR